MFPVCSIYSKHVLNNYILGVLAYMLNLYFFLSIIVDVWSHSDTLRGACQFLKGNKMSSTVRYEKIGYE